MKVQKIPSIRLREWLLTFNVCLSYFVFTIFGMVIVKYNMFVINYLDIIFIPVGLSSILFLYLFAFTYERKLRLSNDVIEVVRLYGLGNSFQQIQDKMGFSNPNEVKRRLTEYCKVKS